MAPKFYRSKPCVVEAVQWTGDNSDALIDWMGTRVSEDDDAPDVTFLETDNGDVPLEIGDWVCRESNGDCFVVDAEAFGEGFEAVDA